jgi:SAM-dependent methyltransferase
VIDPSSYHERVWAAIPEGREPAPTLELRRRFLFEQARSLESREHEREECRHERVRVLDVGCGEAQLASELARAGFSVVGVDVAREPLRRAAARDPALELRLVPEHGGWDLEDSSFDLVWAGDVIEHVTDTLAFFSEVRRVLRSGGGLALTTPALSRLSLLAVALSPSPDSIGASFDPRGDHVRFYSRRSLHALLVDFDFDEVRVCKRGPRLAPRERVLLASARRTRFIG